jgi:hypothetical protein
MWVDSDHLKYVFFCFSEAMASTSRLPEDARKLSPSVPSWDLWDARRICGMARRGALQMLVEVYSIHQHPGLMFVV